MADAFRRAGRRHRSGHSARRATTADHRRAAEGIRFRRPGAHRRVGTVRVHCAGQNGRGTRSPVLDELWPAAPRRDARGAEYRARGHRATQHRGRSHTARRIRGDRLHRQSAAAARSASRQPRVDAADLASHRARRAADRVRQRRKLAARASRGAAQGARRARGARRGHGTNLPPGARRKPGARAARRRRGSRARRRRPRARARARLGAPRFRARAELAGARFHCRRSVVRGARLGAAARDRLAAPTTWRTPSARPAV